VMYNQKKYWILEVNSQPWFKTHYLPMEWKPRNVAWAILDLYFWK
jgi:D-alanine-D-alanine ligase-like ATP-grasp enzyme